MEIHVIELKKYEGDIESVKTALDRWIVFLTRAHEFSRSKIPSTLAEVTSIARAIEILDTMGLSTDERAVYEGRLKWLRDEEMAIQTAHMRGKAEGRAEALSEALKRLLEAGISEEQSKKMLGLE
jgi:predicted transposase/invertase (TIGR01784 family)